MSWDNVVGVATRLWAAWSGVLILAGMRELSLL
jgi:hypothetical protein